jgi:hypothetical protein
MFACANGSNICTAAWGRDLERPRQNLKGELQNYFMIS